MKFYIRYLIFLSLIFVCQCQSITEPKLSSIIPLNSTALQINWLFANSIYDQSDYVQITIQFIEFIYNFNYTYPNIIYTYSLTNKTSLTSLTQNFKLVNGFVYLCFLSNSTITNSTTYVFWKTCRLARTCTRDNSLCSPQTFFVLLSSYDITTNSFTITLHWLRNLPYIQSSPSVKLLNSDVSGTPLTTTQNETFYNQPFRFSNLSPSTNYTVSIIVNYTIFDTLISETLYRSVVTSDSSGRLYASYFLWPILAFYFYLIK